MSRYWPECNSWPMTKYTCRRMRVTWWYLMQDVTNVNTTNTLYMYFAINCKAESSSHDCKLDRIRLSRWLRRYAHLPPRTMMWLQLTRMHFLQILRHFQSTRNAIFAWSGQRWRAHTALLMTVVTVIISQDSDMFLKIYPKFIRRWLGW